MVKSEILIIVNLNGITNINKREKNAYIFPITDDKNNKIGEQKHYASTKNKATRVMRISEQTVRSWQSKEVPHFSTKNAM